MRNLVVEFIGTFFLVLTIGLTGNPYAIGTVLMAMVYFGGHISGGHYNPAVTLSLWLRGAFDAAKIPSYVAAQFLGAFVAAYASYLLIGETFSPAPASGVTATNALLGEVIFTFALCAVILATATSKKMKGNYIYGLAIGATLGVGALAVGPITGGAFNPAVGTGPAVLSMLMGGSLSHVWLYWVGPLVGGALAAFVFKYVEDEA